MANNVSHAVDTDPRVLPPSEQSGKTPEGSVQSAQSALLSENELDRFRSRWREIQGLFVDRPREAVEEADGLVESLIKRVTQTFTDQRAKLESGWEQGRDVSTEDLRQTLRQYRAFFDQLLQL